MTIINRTHAFIFIHVPKTGGTSVKEHLRDYGRSGDMYVSRPVETVQPGAVGAIRIKKHSSAVQLREALGADTFDNFFKFCVVRNPFFRTISLLRFLKFNFRSWQESHVMETIGSLEEFVHSPMFKKPGPGGIILPQVHWLADKSGRSVVDFIARVENIEEDLCRIRARLSLPVSQWPLVRRNASKGDGDTMAAELASGRVVDAIRTRYARDFEFLGYSTDPSAAAESKRVTVMGNAPG